MHRILTFFSCSMFGENYTGWSIENVMLKNYVSYSSMTVWILVKNFKFLSILWAT